MEGIGVILFVVFAVLAALGKAKQQGTGVPRSGTRLPPRPGSPSWPGGPAAGAGARPPAGGGAPGAGAAPGERAETLVPEDLWAILTGERRIPSSPPPPPPAAAPRSERGTSGFEAVTHRPSAAPPEAAEEEVGAAWQAPREVTDPYGGGRPAVASASYAALPGAGARLAAAAAATTAPASGAPAAASPAAAAPAGAPGRAGRPRARGLFSGAGDLRRAFVAQVVLGPPKSLE